MSTDYQAEARLAYLRWLSNEAEAEQFSIRTIREYVAGEHPTYLTDRQKEFLGLANRDADHLFAHNLCALVVDAAVERLEVTGWRDDSADADLSQQEALAMAWADANRFDTLQDDVHEAAIRDGSSFVIVDWDAVAGTPRWHHNDAFDGTRGVSIHSDPNTNVALFAAKRWQLYDPSNPEDNGRTRMTLYFPDRVEKYISSRGANQGIGGTQWEVIQDPGDLGWPIPWLDNDGQPLGCAVIAFDNPGGSDVPVMIAAQDMLNKSDLDGIAATDAAGFRILWAAGLTGKRKTDGTFEAVTIDPGQLLTIADAAGRLGAVDPVDPGMVFGASRYWIEAISGLTRIPQHLLQGQGGDQPSGESLRMREVGLVDKVKRKQKVFGNAWEDALDLSARLANVRAAMALEWQPMQTQWKEAERPDPPEVVEQRRATTFKTYTDGGIPPRLAAKKAGFTDAEIEELDQELAGDQQRETTNLGAALVRAQREFDRGNVPAAQALGVANG